MSSDLDKLSHIIQAHAHQAAGDATELLRLLRILESLHQDIREQLFQDALPTNRQALHSLLRDMESQGGWPYIPRMQLRAFLKHWSDEISVPVRDETAEQ